MRPSLFALDPLERVLINLSCYYYEPYGECTYMLHILKTMVGLARSENLFRSKKKSPEDFARFAFLSLPPTEKLLWLLVN